MNTGKQIYLPNALLSISSGCILRVELLDRMVLRLLSACDGENVHILRDSHFGLFVVQLELCVD